MKTNLLMDFVVDKKSRQVKVKREFAAPLEKVWAAWTEPELIDQWWAPKPWKAVTKSMDFRVGGTWIYAMVGPDGSKHWAVVNYTSISPKKSFGGVDAFSDDQGKINTELPVTKWHNTFSEESGSTFVTIETSYEKLEDLEKIIEMGFKEGFMAALENLDALLKG
jgi:uncharacterized protein YndB with AHSA1/START domain